jgi:trans-aconitate methyltransferase
MLAKAMTFDTDAGLYEKMRPGYPKSIFRKLERRANLNSRSKILEIGCGTGQATKDLVNISRHITCVEPGVNLMAAAKKKYPGLAFHNSTFEDFESDQSYDLIIAATAWHWIDPDIGCRKAYGLLEDDGVLAVLDNYHFETDPNAFHNRAQFIFSKYSGRRPDLSSQEPIDRTTKSLENIYIRLDAVIKTSWAHTYTIDEYIALRNTYSDHLILTPEIRKKMEKELTDFAIKEYGGKVTKHYTAVLFLATKKLKSS